MQKWLKQYFWSISLTAIFIITRILFYYQGIRFDGSMLAWAWQLLDVELLQHDLLRSTFYLHSQPPLFNIFCGIVLQIFGNHHQEAFHIIFMCVGLLTALIMGDIMRKLGISAIISLIITVIFICSPVSILYENWLFYSHLEPFLILIIVWGSLKYFKLNESKKHLWLTFIATSVLCLSRSMFHLIFFLAIIGLFIIFSNNKRRVIYISVLPFLATFIWYTKNLILFGTFTASTWFGMNFARLSYNNDTQLGKTGVWGCPEIYDSLFHFKNSPYESPALSSMRKQNNACNYNYHGYIQVCEQFKKETLTSLKSNPNIYKENIKQAISIFFEPASQVRFGFLETNRSKIPTINKIYNYGYVYPDAKIGSELIWLNIIIYLIIFVASLAIMMYYRRTYVGKTICVILFISFYIFCIGNMFELYENNRFRLPTIPLFLILGGFLVHSVLFFLKKNLINNKLTS